MATAFLMGQSGKKLVGNAVAADVLAPKTFSNNLSNKLTGTMVNRGKVDNQIAINGSFTIPQGYHDGTGVVFQSVSVKAAQTYTPSVAQQVIDAGQYLTGAQTITGDANLVAANIKSGVTIFGVIGAAPIPGGTATSAQILAGYTFVNSGGVTVTGTIPSKTAETFTPGTSNQTIAIGSYISGTQTILGDADLVSANIKAGANIFGVAGTAPVPSGNATVGQVLAGHTFSNAGSVGLTGTMPNRGLPALYDNVQLSKHVSGNLQLAVSGGSYTEGNAYIYNEDLVEVESNLVPGNIKAGVKIFTTTGTAPVPSGTAAAAQVLTGYTFSNSSGVGLSGSMPNQANDQRPLAAWSSAAYPGILSFGIAKGAYLTDSGLGAIATVQGYDANFIQSNIKNGVNMFGLTGTYKGTRVGDVWSSLITNPFGRSPIYGITDVNGVAIAAGKNGAISRSTDNGLTWSSLITNPFGTNPIIGIASVNGVAIAVTYSGAISRSTDNGLTWSSLISTGTSSMKYIANVNGVAIAVGYSGAISRSTDNGLTWSSLITNPFGTKTIECIANVNGVAIAVGYSGAISRSTDNGLTWSSLITNPFGTASIYDIANVNGVAIAVGGSGNISRSTDNGLTWSSLITNPFGTASIECITNVNGVAIAAGDGGAISRSTDNGLTWSSLITNPFGTSLIERIIGVNGVAIAVGGNKISRSIEM